VSRLLSAKLEVRQAFPKVSAHLRRVLLQEYAALALRDEESGQLVRQAIDFPLAKGVSIGGEISTAKAAGEKALKQRSSLIFATDQMQGFDPVIAASLTAEGLKSLVSLLCSPDPAQGSSGTHSPRQHPTGCL
jgi:hypothetical protein